MLDEIRPIVVATHPRSGTHLTIDLLRKQFQACQGWLWFGETLHHLYLNLDRLIPGHSPGLSLDRAQGLLQRASRPIIKTHSKPEFAKHEDAAKQFARHVVEAGDVIYVVRDGRDVLCSAHVWRQEYDPSARCSLAKFIRQRIDGKSRVELWADHVAAWTSREKVHVLKFEDIISSTRVVIKDLAERLALDPMWATPHLPEKIEQGGRWADYWRRVTRNFESTAITGRYNGKGPEDWVEVFTERDRLFFEEEAGDTLRAFGYEYDEQWVTSTQ